MPIARIVLVVLLTVVADVAAQVNTERMRRAQDDDGLRLTVDATAAFATGNTEYLQLGLGGRADWQRGPHLAFVVGETRFSRADATVYLDRQFVHARYNRRLAARLVAEAFSQAERNRQQRLEARTLVGAGVRFEAFETERAGLAIGSTPMVEYERLTDAAMEPPATVVRWSHYVSGRLRVGEAGTLTAVAYAQPRVDEVGDVRVLAQSALEVGVTRALRLRLRANLRFDSRPPLGVEPTDLTVENGLVFAFGP